MFSKVIGSLFKQNTIPKPISSNTRPSSPSLTSSSRLISPPISLPNNSSSPQKDTITETDIDSSDISSNGFYTPTSILSISPIVSASLFPPIYRDTTFIGSIIPKNTSINSYSPTQNSPVLSFLNPFFSNSLIDNELHCIVKENNPELLKKTLDDLYESADKIKLTTLVNARNAEGLTPFTLALSLNSKCALIFFNTETNNYEVNFNAKFEINKDVPIIIYIARMSKYNDFLNDFLTNEIIPLFLNLTDIDLNVTDLNGLTALIHTIENNNHTALQCFLDDERVDINKATYKKSDKSVPGGFKLYNPVAIAMLFENYGAVKKIIACSRFEYNYRLPYTLLSSLSLAIFAEKHKAVQILMYNNQENVSNGFNNKLDINSQTQAGYTPLYFCIMKTQILTAIDLLMHKDIKPNLWNKENETGVLHECISKKFTHKKERNLLECLIFFPKVDLFLNGPRKLTSPLMLARQKENHVAIDIFKKHLDKNYKLDILDDYPSLSHNFLNEENKINIKIKSFPPYKKSFKDDNNYDNNYLDDYFIQILKSYQTDDDYVDKYFIKVLEACSQIEVSKGGILFSEETSDKIALARFIDNKLFITLCDFDIFSDYVFKKAICPFSRSPLTSCISPEESLNDKVVVLDKYKLKYIAKVLNNNFLEQEIQRIQEIKFY